MPDSSAPPEPLDIWASGSDGDRIRLPGTAVEFDGAGILALGASGSGKSSLALQLCALGAWLICDDAVWVSAQNGALHLHRPDQAPDLIEVRGIGLLRAGPVAGQAPLSLVVDLDRAEPDRLPPRRIVTYGDGDAALILGAGIPNLAAGLCHLLRHGRAPI